MICYKLCHWFQLCWSYLKMKLSLIFGQILCSWPMWHVVNYILHVWLIVKIINQAFPVCSPREYCG